MMRRLADPTNTVVGTTTVVENNNCSNCYLLGSVYLRFSSCVAHKCGKPASRLDPAKKMAASERDRLTTSTK